MSTNDPTPPQPPSGPPQPPVPPSGYGYPQPQYGYPQGAYYQPRPTNGFAIASLVCAFLCWPLGLIFGFVARNQIKERGDGGEGLALAGIIISFVFLAGTVLYIVLAAAVIGSHPTFNITIPPQPT